MPEVAVTGGYNRGQEGYAVIGIETTAIAPDTVTLPAVPTLALMGYANVPSAQKSNGATKIFAAGSPYPLAIRKNRRENNLSGTMTLRSSAAPLRWAAPTGPDATRAVIAQIKATLRISYHPDYHLTVVSCLSTGVNCMNFTISSIATET